MPSGGHNEAQIWTGMGCGDDESDSDDDPCRSGATLKKPLPRLHVLTRGLKGTGMEVKVGQSQKGLSGFSRGPPVLLQDVSCTLGRLVTPR